MSQCCLLSMVLSCEMPSCLCGIFLPRATLTGERRQRPRATITATQTSSGTNLSPYLQSLPIETAHAILNENWITEVHICLKDSICMNPPGEYELIKAKSDPRAEVRLRWVKVVGATYNGGPALPLHFSRGSSQSHRAPSSTCRRTRDASAGHSGLFVCHL